jgi:hypothetical protein
MKQFLPLLSSAFLLVSCSTAYKTGQTPDDVYFSPERQRDEYARVEKRDDRQYRRQSDEEIREERFLRMRTSDRRYALLDDCDCYCYTGSNYHRYNNYYRYNQIGVGYNNPWYWNSWNWNYNSTYYNPYYNKPYYSGYVAGNTRPRTGNLNTYNSSSYTDNAPRTNGGKFGSNSRSDNNYQGSGNNAGGFLRDVFSGSSNSSSRSTSSSSSSTNTSSSSSSSSGSSSSGGRSSSAPVRKF